MIEIINLTSFAVDKTFFARVAKNVLKGENRKRENISIAFVSTLEIQKINKKYRKKDKPTDVLSFEKILDFKKGFSEIIICPEFVRKKARYSRLHFKKELSKMLIHGILHALGYDHEKSSKEAEIMEKKQNYYLSQI